MLENGSWVLQLNSGKFRFARHKEESRRYRWITVQTRKFEYASRAFPRTRQQSSIEWDPDLNVEHAPHEGRCGVSRCKIDCPGAINLEERAFMYPGDGYDEFSCVEPDVDLIHDLDERRNRLDDLPSTRAGRRR